MTFSRYKYLIFSDLYRITGNTKFTSLLRHAFAGDSFKYNFWMRTCAYSRNQAILKFLLFPLARVLLRHFSYQLGIGIPYYTKIDSGFYIGHFSGVIVNGESIIGKNCNISQGVTLGQANRGKNKGCPILGDNVYIGPGAKIVGQVRIGNNVAIGANCVVTKDIPDNAVVVGIPGKVISEDGAEGYVNHIDYDNYLNNPLA